jgi:hypothetical protein
MPSCGIAQARIVKFGQAQLVTLEIDFRQDGLFALFQQRIQASQYHHRQDDIAVFTAHVDIAQTIVSNGPDKGDEFVMYSAVQGCLSVLRGF